MGNYNFQKDLAESAVATKEAIARIKHHFPGLTDVKEYNGKEYDVIGSLDGKTVTFELKNELMVQKTGNVAIEFECRGHKSGIDVTTADYWVESIRDGVYIIPTEELRQRIARQEFDMIKGGGDFRSNTRFYLIKEAKFISWCIKM